MENLFVAHTQVNRGHFFKRRFPRSQGRVNYIKKRTCQVIITLKYTV
jgi:ribosomal protein L22